MPPDRVHVDGRASGRLRGGQGAFGAPTDRRLGCCTATRVTIPTLSAGGANGTLPNIPPKANRGWKPCFSPVLYRSRNAIERMFCRLKDFRRVATRYDRLATNYLAAVCLAATVSYWL